MVTSHAAPSPVVLARRADASDREFCRAMLPRVSRTFALNMRLLDGTLGEAVRTGYLLCRAADALEDSWPGPPERIRDRFDRFAAALRGDAQAQAGLAGEAHALAAGRADLALVAELGRPLRVAAALPPAHRAALVEGVGTLAAGMGRYAARAAGRPAGAPYLDTEAELEDYCWVVAGCVGVMLTRLFAAAYGPGAPELEARRLAAAPAVGEALQLTNILLDWPADVRGGRCYLPASWLAEAGVAPPDLVGVGGEGARAVARRLERKARAALATVPDYLDLIPSRRVRYRLFCLWPALWALDSLDHARRDPDFPWGPRRPRLPRSRVWGAAFVSTFAVLHPAALRALYRRAGREAPGRPGARTRA